MYFIALLFHISDKESNENAAYQRHSGGWQDNHNYTSSCDDQTSEARSHNNLSQLDHTGECRTVHAGASRAFSAAL